MTPNKTQTTNITNPKLNYINYIGKTKGKINKTKFTITNTTPQLGCLYKTGTAKP
jgi:hypothetical protein